MDSGYAVHGNDAGLTMEKQVLAWLKAIATMQRRRVVEGRFAGFAEMVLAYGRIFDPPRRTVTRALRKYCYLNAADYAADHGALYVEGWAIPAGLPIPLEHAWCADPRTGEAWDPTWEDGAAYVGIPVTAEYRDSVRDRGWSLFYADARGHELLCEEFPDGAVAVDVGRPIGDLDTIEPTF